ncbi:MAG: hypothetical protein ACREBF_00335 [Candidatus Micrarchaeales archaeon]
MVVEDINFLDVACLMRIGPDTVMEKFGGLINTSFFDASTIAGTLKQKGLIEFTNDYPGPNGILISQQGKAILAEADAKSTEPFDTLDSTILQQMSGGKRLPFELGNSLNIRSKDLAFRLYKLYKQNYLIYELKNGNVDLLLTEGGFLKIKNIMPASVQNVAQPKQGIQLDKILQPNANQTQVQQEVRVPKSRRGMIFGVVIVIVIVVAVYYLHYIGNYF